MDEIRGMWRVPSIGHFCSLFREAFDLPEFDLEDFEEALIASQAPGGCAFLVDIICRLLNGYYTRRDIVESNYDVYLKDLFRSHREAEGRSDDNPVAETNFDSLSLAGKVNLLHELCDYRLYEEQVEEQLRGVESNNLRLIPLGWDASGAAYWYFYGTRLYKETPPAKPLREKETSKKRKSKHKEKVIRKRSKVDQERSINASVKRPRSPSPENANRRRSARLRNQPIRFITDKNNDESEDDNGEDDKDEDGDDNDEDTDVDEELGGIPALRKKHFSNGSVNSRSRAQSSAKLIAPPPRNVGYDDENSCGNGKKTIKCDEEILDANSENEASDDSNCEKEEENSSDFNMKEKFNDCNSGKDENLNDSSDFNMKQKFNDCNSGIEENLNDSSDFNMKEKFNDCNSGIEENLNDSSDFNMKEKFNDCNSGKEENLNDSTFEKEAKWNNDNKEKMNVTLDTDFSNDVNFCKIQNDLQDVSLITQDSSLDVKLKLVERLNSSNGRCTENFDDFLTHKHITADIANNQNSNENKDDAFKMNYAIKNETGLLESESSRGCESCLNKDTRSYITGSEEMSKLDDSSKFGDHLSENYLAVEEFVGKYDNVDFCSKIVSKGKSGDCHCQVKTEQDAMHNNGVLRIDKKVNDNQNKICKYNEDTTEMKGDFVDECNEGKHAIKDDVVDECNEGKHEIKDDVVDECNEGKHEIKDDVVDECNEGKHAIKDDVVDECNEGKHEIKDDVVDECNEGKHEIKDDVVDECNEGKHEIKDDVVDECNEGKHEIKDDVVDECNQRTPGIEGDVLAECNQRTPGLGGDVPDECNQITPGIEGDVPDECNEGTPGIEGDVPDECNEGTPGIEGDVPDECNQITPGIEGDVPDECTEETPGVEDCVPEECNKGTPGIEGDVPDECNEGTPGIEGCVPDECNEGTPSNDREQEGKSQNSDARLGICNGTDKDHHMNISAVEKENCEYLRELDFIDERGSTEPKGCSHGSKTKRHRLDERDDARSKIGRKRRGESKGSDNEVPHCMKKSVGFKDLSSSQTGWSLVCSTTDDWRSLVESLDPSVKCERALANLITSSFLPHLPELEAAKLEAQQKKLLEFAPKRISGRLETQRQKQLEQEKALAEIEEEEARQKALMEEQKEKVMERQRQAERERRVQERERIKEERAKRLAMREARAQLIADGKEIPPELIYSNTSINNRGISPYIIDRDDQVDEEMITGFYKVYDAVKMHKDSWPFWDPVDTNIAPDYYDIIKKPIDLSTIQQRLDNNVYETKRQFVADFQLMFNNCVLYNGRRNQLSCMARSLEAELTKALQKFLPDDDYHDRGDDVDYYARNRTCPKRAASSRAHQVVHQAVVDIRSRCHREDDSGDDEDEEIQPKPASQQKLGWSRTVVRPNIATSGQPRISHPDPNDRRQALSSRRTQVVRPTNGIVTASPAALNKYYIHRNLITGALSLVDRDGKMTPLKVLNGKLSPGMPVANAAQNSTPSKVATLTLASTRAATVTSSVPNVTSNLGVSTVFSKDNAVTGLSVSGSATPAVSPKVYVEKSEMKNSAGQNILIVRSLDGSRLDASKAGTVVDSPTVSSSISPDVRKITASQRLISMIQTKKNSQPLPETVGKVVQSDVEKPVAIVRHCVVTTQSSFGLTQTNPVSMSRPTSITALQPARVPVYPSRNSYNDDFASFSRQRQLSRNNAKATTPSTTSDIQPRPPTILPVYVSTNKFNRARKAGVESGSFKWNDETDEVLRDNQVKDSSGSLGSDEKVVDCLVDPEMPNLEADAQDERIAQLLSANEEPDCEDREENVSSDINLLVKSIKSDHSNKGESQINYRQTEILPTKVDFVSGLSSILQKVKSPDRTRKSVSFGENVAETCKSFLLEETRCGRLTSSKSQQSRAPGENVSTPARVAVFRNGQSFDGPPVLSAEINLSPATSVGKLRGESDINIDPPPVLDAEDAT